jgi:1,4-alpha-glucan branching enzyme
MKRTNGQRRQNTKSREAASQVVRVEFKHPSAEAVSIAGSFNDWRPEASQMVAVGDGRWLKELVLPPGTYEYLFVADGEWVADPLAKRAVPNPFGGVNSVFEVFGDTAANGNGSGSNRNHR